ncbi:hypothetical protein J3R30DRAFT_3488960 [Lentinula aciculospora]|uniref:Retrotransposon gag domain-containing protein n=1 Tax=Lentinula aciculospora TaxID=153920 RepID=A0A9W9AAX3_9AGAR|nr:hypothetical protein J3R30DRAFT_3488960 [Lentinula aciculospora]
MLVWTSSFVALVKELQDNFAEDKIGMLRMKESDNVWKYNIHFNTLAASTNWDLHALKWAYQCGLASRIKDEMAHLLEPKTLMEYHYKVLCIDNRYWT